MRRTPALFWLMLTASSASAETHPEAHAFEIFEGACLHDQEQFNAALALATERAMPVAPKPIRDALRRGKEGAAWVASETPFIAIHAELAAGCGIMMKPASEVDFQAELAEIEGLKAVSKSGFEQSWSVWYRLTRKGNRGILLAGYLAESEKPSAFLRYMPADFVSAHDEASDFLLTDYSQFNAVRRSLEAD